MIAFIDDHRSECGVEPICRVLKIAPSTFHAHAARRARPERGGSGILHRGLLKLAKSGEPCKLEKQLSRLAHAWRRRLISTSMHLSAAQAVAVLAGGLAVFLTALFRAPMEPVLSVVLAFGLVYASTIDLDRRILPDPLTIGLIVAGLSAAAAFRFTELDDRIVGAVVGYVSLLLVEVTYRALRKRDGLGRGDAKLFAAGGAWVGWASLPAVMLVASIAALVAVIALAIVRRRLDAQAPVAFGPFISIGIWAIWLLGP